ncbi:MAG: phosphoglycolate phosphatase [Betaproteobacteria bacterium]|nr:phosphoglycolate phosphatase [Betaproteobacteria bacterium]
MIRAVLFDLDGTFADTAPDLCDALNRVRAARALPPLPVQATRPVTSMGARGLLGVGFNIGPEHPDYAQMREEFLAFYEQNLCRETRLFPGIKELLDEIEQRRLPWGIVTNKAERFALPLLNLLDLRARAACVIGGDTTGKLKPNPDPLLAACRAIGIEPDACVYVGDDRRDIEAARAAGMKSAAAAWGYLNGGDPRSWGADWLIERPEDLLQYL